MDASQLIEEANMKRKILAFILAMTFVAACLPLGIINVLHAETSLQTTDVPTITVGSASAKPGATVSVDINIRQPIFSFR